VRELSKAFALAVSHEQAIRIHDDVAFFQAVRSVLVKRAEGDARPEEELDRAIRQIVSRAVASEGVVDIFDAAGLKRPIFRSCRKNSSPRQETCLSEILRWDCCRSC